MEANISRHELKIKHRQLVEHANKTKADYESIRDMLQSFNDSYIQLYAVFPFWRYPKLKRLIKTTTAQSAIDDLQQKVNESQYTEQENTEGDRDAAQAGDETEQSDRPLVSGGKPFGKAKQALRKIEKFCGLDDEPIEDEDVMNNTELWRRIERKERAIRFQHSEMQKALNELKKLQTKYIRSKSSIFPRRFFALKRMVREFIAVTKPDSKYEN